jgi:RNA polymerase sigma-70 factor (ECF subfamily)
MDPVYPDMQLALNATVQAVEDLPVQSTVASAAGLGTDSVTSELDDIEALVRTYRPRVLRYVTFSIGDPDLAESITQDCFLKAYNGRAGFRGDCSVSTWLTSIAVNLVRDQQRLQKFRFWRQARATAVDISEAANFLPSQECSPENRILAKERAQEVYTALEKLSEKQRTVFLMRFVEEMELAEIARATSMPLNTVKTHLHRALKAVRGMARTR